MIDNNIIPIFSTLLSIILFIGCYEIGKILSLRLKLNNILYSITYIEFQYISFTIILLLLILFPIIAFTNSADIILKIFSLILIVFGIKFLLNLGKLIRRVDFSNKDKFFKLYLLFLLLYFFLALSPLTSADILDYHNGVAQNILRFNQYNFFPEWFTSMQSGTGEILISLGFSVGAEQFGSLIQFSSILSISGIILKFGKINNIFPSRYLLILTVISCPILIFLLSGNKPQIFYSSLMFLAFILNFTKQPKRNDNYIIYLLINLLICLCVMGKFSFNLIGFIVWVYSTINFVNKKNYLKLLSIPLLVFLFLYFPFLYWKFSNLGGNFLSYILSPFPLHLPGYENFLSHNKGSQEIPFPKFLIYTSLSRITEFLAANTILFIVLLICLKKNKKILPILLMVTIFVLISNIYASPSARYYLDVILLMTAGVLMIDSNKYLKNLKYIFYPQILICLIILAYSTFNFLPGAFFSSQYEKIKHKHAYMYSGFDWLNKTIPNGSSVLIVNRPISLYKNFAVSGNFNYFTNDKDAVYYKKLIKKYALDYIVYFGNEPKFFHLTNCTSGLYTKKDKVGYHATRNPFNRGGYYNGYIYNFDSSKLPNC